MKSKYNTIIIGGGPAGIFAAYNLVKNGKKDICIIEKGKNVKNRKSLDALFGMGGGGLFSDGKLNLVPRRSKTNLLEFVELSEAEAIIQNIDDIFSEFGVNEISYPTDLVKATKYRLEAKKLGIDLMVYREKHLGSDKLPIYINNFEEYLIKNGVDIITEIEVEDILSDGEKITGVQLENGTEIGAKFIIASPGRAGNIWLSKQFEKLGIITEQGAIQIGIRVEMAHEIMEEMTNVIYDPPIFLRSKSFDDEMETFCTNPFGYLAQENYKNFACVNGHARKDKQSENTNFALLVKVTTSNPTASSISYGEQICRLANVVGGGKPILQRYIDLKRHQRSTWDRINRSDVSPTLKDIIPGDISMAFPHRIVTDLIEGIEKLDTFIPGIGSDSTLLYCPEVKFFSVRPEINKNLETKIKGLFVAGDGAGVSGNIIGAAATGIIATNGLIKTYG